MKILHVIAAVHKQGGGTSEVVPRICRAQKGAGHEVSLIALKTSDVSEQADLAMKSGVEFVFIDGLSRLPVMRTVGYASDFYSKVQEAISRTDIVHIHGLWMYPVWAAAKAARKLGKPYVVMPHGFLERERLKVSKWKKRISATLFDRRVLKGAKAIIATSESEAHGIHAFGLANPTYIMPLGLDIAASDALARDKRCEKKTLLYLSRITPIKGLDMLAEVWSKLQPEFPNWKLRMVGPDDRGYAKEVERMFSVKCAAASYSIEGPVFGGEKMDALRSADAFVLPTRSENWSVAVAEAMASGLPVVCTKGAPWKCLNDVCAGAWVEISEEAIYRGLRAVMSCSDLDRRTMGENGRKWAQENLSWNPIVHRLVSYYEYLLRGFK